MTQAKHTPAAWQESKCNVPMWSLGTPSGFCGNAAYGHQLPERYLFEIKGMNSRPYCFGHACPEHGGPSVNEVRIFQDGVSENGRPMWCAVMQDFINLHESVAAFDENPVLAVAKLRAEITKATGA